MPAGAATRELLAGIDRHGNELFRFVARQPALRAKAAAPG